MKILVLNGPNINMLGIREPDIYGKQTYHNLLQLIQDTAKQESLEIEHYQSNHEGALVDKIQDAYGKFDGIVINPAAYTHTSIAILDALKSVSTPTVEVHISNVYQREDFRRRSIISPGCIGFVGGFGLDSYRLAIEALIDKAAESHTEE